MSLGETKMKVTTKIIMVFGTLIVLACIFSFASTMRIDGVNTKSTITIIVTGRVRNITLDSGAYMGSIYNWGGITQACATTLTFDDGRTLVIRGKLLSDIKIGRTYYFQLLEHKPDDFKVYTPYYELVDWKDTESTWS